MNEVVLVVTSINAPNKIIQALAGGAVKHGWKFIVVGDSKSPVDYFCEGVAYYSLDSQLATGFEYAQQCPVGHYARKNIGYLIAMRQGANIIVETDDDNMPRDNFWLRHDRVLDLPQNNSAGWVNVYRYFSDALVWPRGLPLTEVQRPLLSYDELPVEKVDCPIQQGLADDNPDVDAIYRLLLPLPQLFLSGRQLALGKGSWCPFNSQNTTWWQDAFPLLYLPAYCSFRMTDIWRSFIAQRIAWECGWSIRFYSASVWQERNEHNLMRDFADEVPGYLNNAEIAAALARLSLRSGKSALQDNLLRCYEALVKNNWMDEKELILVKSWLVDVNSVLLRRV